MTDQNKITIDILGRHFKIKCPSDKAAELQRTAAFVDDMMQEVREQGILAPDRIAIMTAINIAHELLLLREQKDSQLQNMGERLRKLQQRVEYALSQDTQMEFEE